MFISSQEWLDFRRKRLTFEVLFMNKQRITLQELTSAKASVSGRLAQLRRTPWRYGRDGSKSPIAKFDAFAEGIDEIENVYREMQQRIDNAKITIEL